MPPVLRSRTFLGACIVLAAAICYLPAMGAGFVWDDDLLVTENPLVKGADSLPYIWASSAATDYTPLTTTVFWLQWRLWRDNAAGYHLVNILLFAASALLLWRMLARLAIPGAWLGALLFAMHPVNVASVAWIAELKNALSLPFYLGAICAFLAFLESGKGTQGVEEAQTIETTGRKRTSYVLALLAAACALLSKGSTAILPLVLLLCTWWTERRIRRVDWLALLPFFLLSGMGALATIHFQARIIDPTVHPAPLTDRIARAGQALWFYLGKDLWPVHLCAVYPKWRVDRTFLPLLAAMGLALLFWLARRRIGRGPFFAWAYFVITLLPVLGVLNMSFLDQAWVADWWQELALPAVAASAAAGAAILWVRLTRAGRVALSLFIAAILLFLGARTWSEAAGYESMETLCRRTLAGNPNAWIAHNNLGSALMARGDLAGAASEYEAALRLKPMDSGAHSNLGIVYVRLHRLDDGIAEYHAALDIAPDSAKTWFNLGNALRAERKNGAAIDALEHAIDLNGRWISPRYEMGTILLEEGRTREAGHQAQTIVALDPASLSGHYLFARAAAAAGRFDVAVVEASTALGLARQSGDAKTIQQMQDVLDACRARRLPAAPDL